MTTLSAAIAAAQRSKAKPKRKNDEHAFQAALVQLLDIILPAEAITTSIDHAGATSAVTGAMRRARGVLAGIPDTLIAWQPDPLRNLQVVVWLETKATRGRLSGEQQVWRDTLIRAGHYWGAPRTIEEALATIREAGIPIRNVQL